MSYRELDPLSELTHRAEAEGVSPAVLLKRMLKKEPVPLAAHLAGPVPWAQAKRLIEKSQVQIAAGKTHSWTAVKKYFAKKRKAK